MNLIKDFGDMTVSSNIGLTVERKKRILETDVYEYEFLFNWDEEQAKEAGSKVVLLWDLPCIDVQYMWHPNCRPKRVLDANWRLRMDSMLTGSAPIALLFNGADQNSYTFATDEVKKVTGVRFGVEDSRNTITGEISMGLKQFAGKNSDRLLVRADFRRVPYYESLDDVRVWWEKVLPVAPMAVPETAHLPMYSSWYNFHQDFTAEELEAECRRAKDLGMSAVIVDDGWQTEDRNCNYGYTGDWEVCKKKIPDMCEHVRRVHEIGLKYILWYSVPFVGYYSKNWELFKNKLIYKVDRNECGVLDPRYPECREFLIGVYERAVREYDLDGFKLDFIDRFVMREDDQIMDGMDYTCIQEAVERLMTDIMLRLKALKPDIMIEFRQKYIGPAMREFGNMFRVADCPSDITINRTGTVDLRLLSGNTACHSDMLTWHKDEAVEDAALQILNAIFGVIQFSQKISDMTEEHKKMTAFWLDFAVKNRKLLQESQLIPFEPHFLYPVIKAQDGQNTIIRVYMLHKVIDIETGLMNVKLLNATKETALYLNFNAPCDGVLTVFSVLGEVLKMESIHFEKGVAMVQTPRSGMLELQFT